MREIDSNNVQDLLIEWKEPELFSAFKAIVSCHDGILNTSIDAKTYGEDRFEEQRRIINLKKDKVIELAKFFDLDVSPLFEALNIANENIIKKTCKELGLTYSQLADEIGYGENSVSNASRGEISKAMQKAIELYLRNLELKTQLEDYETFKTLIKKAIN